MLYAFLQACWFEFCGKAFASCGCVLFFGSEPRQLMVKTPFHLAVGNDCCCNDCTFVFFQACAAALVKWCPRRPDRPSRTVPQASVPWHTQQFLQQTSKKTNHMRLRICWLPLWTFALAVMVKASSINSMDVAGITAFMQQSSSDDDFRLLVGKPN